MGRDGRHALQPHTLKFKVVLYLTIALSAAMLLFTGAGRLVFVQRNPRQGVRSRHPALRSDHQEHPLRDAAEPARLCRPHHPRRGQSGENRPGQNPEQRGKDHPFDLRAGNRPDGRPQGRGLLALPPERAAARAGSQERANLDVQRPEWRVAARQHGSHPQRAVLLQRRLPSAREGNVGPRRSRHRLFARRYRSKIAHQHARDRRLFVGVHRASRRCWSASSCTVWSTCRCATSKAGRNGSPPAIWTSRSRCAATTNSASLPPRSTA